MGRGAARRATLRAAQGREATQGYDLYLAGGSLCLALPSYIIIATLKTSGSDVRIGLVTYLYLMIVKALCPAQVMLFFPTCPLLHGCERVMLLWGLLWGTGNGNCFYVAIKWQAFPSTSWRPA